MESLSTSKWVICRICLRNYSDKMHKIFTENEEVEDLVGKIRLCGGISLHNSDQLPDKICYKCLLLLKLAYKFRTLCQKSHQQLSNLLPALSEGNSDGTDDNFINNGKYSLEVKLETESPAEEDSKCMNPEAFNEDESQEYMQHAEPSQNEDVEYLHDDYVDNSDQSVDGESKITSIKFEYSEIDDNSAENKLVAVIPREQKKICAATDQSRRRKRKRSVSREPKKNTKVIVKTKEDDCTTSNFICCHCGNIYAERSKLTLHLKIHSKEKPHECEICHKRFAQTPQLSRHMNSHTGSRPYKCKFCASSFADPSTCIKHERIHTNERPYKCHACSKSFSYSNVLKVHMMTHTGEKPYSCKYCEKTFAQVHHRKAHERTHTVQSVDTLKVLDSNSD